MNHNEILDGNMKNNKYINKQNIIEKPWGREIWLELNDKYCYKRIEIKAGFKTSFQIHNFKRETNYIIQGKAEIWLENDEGIVEKFFMSEGDFFNVIPKRKHRVIAITDLILQEVSTPEVDDVIRINDEYNRGNGKIEEEHQKPILCIIAAGIGSRLGEISKSCHKTLLPYKNKAILSHIIEKFKSDIDIVIAVGHLSDQIIEYVNFYHSNRNIKFINVDNYKLKGSGPAYSLECCRSLLQKPFYFCVSDFYTDTFLQNDILCTENWIGLYETTKPELYSTVKLNNDKVEKIINKSENGYPNAFTGIFYMYNFKLFWESFDKYVDEKKEVVDIFTDIQSFNFKIKNINWYDVGTIDLYKKFIENYEGKNLYLHNIKQEYKYKKNNLFIKKMETESKLKNIIKRSQYLEKYIPKIIGSGKYYLCYEYIEGNTLYFVNDKNKYINFLNWFEINFCKNNNNLPNSYNSKYSEEFYKIKTYKRLNMFKEKRYNFEILDNIDKINGYSVLKIEDYLNMINWNEIFNIISTALFHGDLQFDNIIIEPNGNFKLIDWREDFGGNTEYGDLYYDLAKLYGGMEINYLEMKNPNNYSHSINNKNECSITEFKDNILIDIKKNEFIYFLNRNNFEIKRVKLLTALIFLNMAPLHINEFDVFLFFKSKLLFADVYKV